MRQRGICTGNTDWQFLIYFTSASLGMNYNLILPRQVENWKDILRVVWVSNKTSDKTKMMAYSGHFPRGQEQGHSEGSGHCAQCSCLRSIRMLLCHSDRVLFILHSFHTLLPFSCLCGVTFYVTEWYFLFPVIHSLAALTFHAQLSNTHVQFLIIHFSVLLSMPFCPISSLCLVCLTVTDHQCLPG